MVRDCYNINRNRRCIMNNSIPQDLLEKEHFDVMKQEDMNEIVRDAERFRKVKAILTPLVLNFSETLEEQEDMLTTVDDMLLSPYMEDSFNDSTPITPADLLEYHRALRKEARLLRGLRNIYREIEENEED